MTATTTSVTNDLCRLTVCGPDRTVEVALPAHAPLADLLPTLIGYLGENLPDSGLAHGGWVLQRLGEAPLDPERSVTALGLHDGDVVHLRPGADQMPPVDFDDLIDGVATGIGQRPDRWRPETTRRVLLGLVPVSLATGLALLASQHPNPLTAIAAAATTLLLLLACGAASRAFGDALGAGLLAAAAIGYAALAGSLVPALVAAAGTSAPLGARWLAASITATGVTALASAASGVGRHVFIGVGLAGALAGVGGAFVTVGHTTAPEAAAIILLVVVPLGAFVPATSFRLAGMRLAPLPTTPEELQADLDPEPSAEVLTRTADTDRYMTASYAGLGSVAASCLAVLALDGHGLPALLTTGDAIALLLLHSRVLVSARQRLSAIVPAVLGAVLLIASNVVHSALPVLLAWLVALLTVTVLLYVGAHTLPGKRLLPYWGRIGDIAQSTCALALLPLSLWLFDAYEFALGLGG